MRLRAQPAAGRALEGNLTTVEYFTFGFGTMVGVGWLVLMDDWLGRGGPGGAMLGFLAGGLLLVPVALTYGRLVAHLPDAGAEIAYTEPVFPRFLSFAAGWTMVLSYAIVCPWEAVATGNLLARLFPALNTHELYAVAGSPIYAPRLVVGLMLTGLVAWVNLRGIRPSGRFQNATTFGLLAVFAVFASLGVVRGHAANMRPLFARGGPGGAALSILLVLQIVPYFLTGFESVAKGSEEARPGFDPRRFGTAILVALVVGFLFYVAIVAVVSFVYPWREIVAGHVRTEAAFERTFGSHRIAELIVFGAFLSLLKIFNGNFVAATRMLYAMGRRRLVHPGLGLVDPVRHTPAAAIALMTVVTAGASMLGDAILVPVSEVGSLSAGVGWLSACAAFIARERGRSRAALTAWIGAMVSLAIVLMKIVPAMPGSFTRAEWIAFAAWTALGVVFSMARPRTSEG